MYNHDDIINNYSVDFDYDSIDEAPEINHYYEASKCFLGKMEEILYFMLQKEPKSTAVWGLLFALGSRHLAGRSMTEVAKKLGVSRAAISKQATLISRQISLPSSPYMAPARARAGKETEHQRIMRLINSAKSETAPEFLHEKIVHLFYDQLDKYVDRFYDKNNPVNAVYPQGEVFGKIYRNYNYNEGEKVYTTIKEVFVKNEKLLQFFDNCTAKTTSILFALKRAGVLKANKTSRWIIDYPQYGCVIQY
jgi:predicted transcriptional regulator